MSQEKIHYGYIDQGNYKVLKCSVIFNKKGEKVSSSQKRVHSNFPSSWLVEHNATKFGTLFSQLLRVLSPKVVSSQV